MPADRARSDPHEETTPQRQRAKTCRFLGAGPLGIANFSAIHWLHSRSKRHRGRIGALRYRPCDGVLPRRVLHDRTRRPWKPHDLRGRHCRVSGASIGDRQRFEYSGARIWFSRPCGGRSVVRYRSKLAPFSSRRGGGICRLSLDPRACPRNSSSGSPPRARRRRSNWTRRSPRLVSADA